MVKAIVFMLLRRGGGAILSILITSFVAKLLGVADYGNYNILINFIILASSLGTLGIESSIPYLISSQSQKSESVVNTAIHFTLILTIVLAIGIWIGLWMFADKGKVLFLYKNLISLTVIVTALTNSLLAIYSGLLKFKLYAILSMIPNISFFLHLLFYKSFSKQTDLGVLMVGYLIGYLICTILLLLFIREMVFFHGDIKFQKQKDVLRQLLSFGLKAYLSNIVTFLNNRSNIFIIVYLTSSTSLSYYSATLPFVEALWLISTSVAAITYPVLSRAENQEKRVVLIPLITWIVLILTTVAGLFVNFVGMDLFTLVFGKSFNQGFDLFRIMLPGIVLWAGARIICTDFSSYGRPEINLYINLFIFCISVPLNFFLIKQFGIKGAAYATCISYSIFFILVASIYLRLFKIPITRFFWPQRRDFSILMNAVTP